MTEAVQEVVVDPVDPAVVETAVNDTEPQTTETIAEETTHVEPAPKVEKEKPWFLKRIAEESAKRVQEFERAQRLEQELATLRATKEPVQQPPQNYQEQVKAEAARQRFYEDTQDVRNRGMATYGAEFNTTLETLNAAGAVSDDFVQDIMAVNKQDAHQLLHLVAQDPNKAVALAAMSSRQRISELTRMAIAASEPAKPAILDKAPVKAVSKAPAPAPKIEPNATKTKDWRQDDASEDDFQRGFEEMMLKRNARR